MSAPLDRVRRSNPDYADLQDDQLIELIAEQTGKPATDIATRLGVAPKVETPLDKVRKSNPDYADASDEQLVDLIAEQTGKPREDIMKRVGATPELEDIEGEKPSDIGMPSWKDYLKTIAADAQEAVGAVGSVVEAVGFKDIGKAMRDRSRKESEALRKSMTPAGQKDIVSGTDFVKAMAAGSQGVLGAVGYLMGHVGAKEAGRVVREYTHKESEKLTKSMTPAGETGMGTLVFEKADDSLIGYRLTDDWGKALLMGASQSLPTMFAGAVPGVGITHGIQALAKLGLAGGSGATIPLLAGVASPVGKGLAAHAAAKAPYAIGMGLGEGMVAAPMEAAQFQTEVEGTPIEELRKSPVFVALARDLGGDEELARKRIAEQATNDIFWRVLGSTSTIGALTGGGVLGHAYQAVTGTALKASGGALGMLAHVGKGIGLEAMQEFPQSGMEKLIENIATRDYLNPDQDIWEGVGEQALSGAAIGAFTGGVVGAGTVPGRPGPTEEEYKKALMAERARLLNTRRVQDAVDEIDAAPDVDSAIQSAAALVGSKPATADGYESELLERAERFTQEGVTSDEAESTGQEAQPQTEVLDRQPTPRDTEIVAEDGQTQLAEWDVVPAETVEQFREGGPRTAEEQATVDSIAAAPDYRRTSDSAVVDTGAPVVDAQGRIVEGQQRAAGLAKAHREGTAAEYRAQLLADAERKGITPERLAEAGDTPVLVRRLVEARAVTPEARPADPRLIPKSKREADARQQDERAVKQLESALQRGGVSWSAEIADVRDPVSVAGKARAGREEADRAGERLAGVFGKRVVWVEAKGAFAFNGVADPSQPDVIFLDISTPVAAHTVVGHELSHHMERDAPEAYKAMVDAIREITKTGAISKYRKALNISEDATDADVLKEIVGDLMGDNFNSQDFWNQVAGHNPSAFRKIADAITKWLDALIGKAQSQGFGSERWVADAKKARAIIAKAVAQYTATQPRNALGQFESTAEFSRVEDRVDTAKVEAEHGVTFETGTPVTFKFVHNTESATKLYGKPKKDDRFLRDKEPSGKYVNHVSESATVLEGLETGSISFKNPLVIPSDGLQWKANLSRAFGDKTGKALSKAIIGAGFDGVVTVTTARSGKTHTSEILDLTSFDETEAQFSRQETITVDGVERPTLNSEGKRIHPTEEGIRNFYRWFKDSKAVDEQGRPRVHYHGTVHDFSEFKMGAEASAAFFSPDKAFTESYTEPAQYGGQIIPVYLRTEKPFDASRPEELKALREYVEANNEIDSKGQITYEIRAIGGRFVPETDRLSTIFGDLARTPTRSSNWLDLERPYIQEAIRGMEYDSFFVKEQGVTNLGVYKPGQVKSAVGNLGTFSEFIDDIVFSRQESDAGVEPTTKQDLEPGSIRNLMERSDWAILTAELDGTSTEEKTAAQAKLRRDLEDGGYEFYDTVGLYAGESAESAGFVVLGIQEDAAHELGNKYKQDSILTRKGLLYHDGTVSRMTDITAYPDKETALADFGYTHIPETGATFAGTIPDFDTRVQSDSLHHEGTHYAHDELTSLRGEFAGKGLPGADNDRIRYAEDPRIKKYVDFYVDLGQGIRPEAGLGGKKHLAALDNIYDASKNERGFRAGPGRDGMNDFESAVLDAGYDGYFVMQGKQGRIRVLGDAAEDIPATYAPKFSRREEPLPGAPRVKGFTGPDPRLVSVAERYAQDHGITLRRQAEYAKVDPERAARIADAYEAMPHAPQDPKVKAAYEDLIRQTADQYQALVDAGYKFWFLDVNRGDNAEYASTPWNAMRDVRANQEMGVFPTADGFGTGQGFNPEGNPLLADTGVRWPVGGPNSEQTAPVLANDMFRAVHDAFGHGLEGAGFRAQGEENAWQAHVRLFTGGAVGAITSETRGQNSWLNYGPHGETNRTAKVEDTIFADQKTGLMPAWTWTEGLVGDTPAQLSRVEDTKTGHPTFSRVEGYPKRAGEPLAALTDVDAMKAHADYSAAKKGDVEAAARLVTDLVPQSMVDEAADRFGADVVYLPVVLKEAGGTNRIPHALASLMASRTNAAVDASVYETEKAFHTGMNMMERLISRAHFAGEITPGTEYVLVDDVTTAGSTLADLASYVQANGGRVEGSVLLTNATRTGSMQPKPATLTRLEKDYGQAIREEFGIEPQALTREESQYLLGFRTADELRNRAAKARDSRRERILSKSVPRSSDAQAETVATEHPEFSRQEHPVFYSELLQELGGLQKITNKAGQVRANQASSWIDSRQKAGKFKQEEVEAIGIRDWLATKGNELVELDDIVNFAEQNGVQVVDVMHGEDLIPYKPMMSYLLGDTNYEEFAQHLPAEVREEITDQVLERIYSAGDSPADVSDYQLERLRQDVIRGINDRDEQEQKTNFDQWTEPGGRDYRELALVLPGEERARVPAAHRMSHEADVNRVAQIRFNSREDEADNKVLFIEEIQSDWGQQGREKGFRAPGGAAEARLAAIAEEKLDIRRRYRQGLDVSTEEKDRVLLRLLVEEDALKSAPVPGPFVQKTEAWTALALKRMLRYAADKGFDRIAWTTGQQQADRYKLSKVVSSVLYRKNFDGTYFIAPRDKSGVTIEDLAKHFATREDIVPMYGVDLWNEVEAGAGDTTDFGMKQIRTEDLKTGGEGMKGFYDNIVPKTANKILRKLGGGEVTTRYVDDVGEVQGFDITPTLKENVEKGLPLFSRKEADAEYMAAAESGDTETAQRMVYEAAKAAGYTVGPVVHRTKDDFTVFDLSKASKSAVWGPAIYASLGDTWNPQHLRGGRDIRGYVGGDVIDLTRPLNPGDLTRLSEAVGRPVDTVPLLSLEKRYGSVAEGLKVAGYSAALHKGPGTSGTHIAVFDPNQIKSAEPITRDDAGNIIPLSERFQESSDDIRFSRQEDTPRNLYVAHNLSANNLRHAAELGGLAAPSIAVARSDLGFDSFGEITLMAAPELLRSPKVRTFDADIYSPRHPRAEYLIDDRKYNKWVDSLGDVKGLYVTDPQNLTDSDGLKELLRSKGVQYAWLRDNGKAPILKPMKITPEIRKLAKAMKEEGTSRIDRFSPDTKAKRIAEALVVARVQDYADRIKGTGEREITEDQRANLTRGYMNDVTIQASRYNKQDGKDLPQLERDIDRKLRDEKVYDQYEAWAEKQFKDVVKGQRMFAGFNYRGDRLHRAYNLENVVKTMTKTLQGGEGFHYGGGSVRAKLATELKNLKQIQAQRDRIVSASEFKAVKNESEERLGEALDQLRPYYKFDAERMNYIDDASSAIAEGPRGWRESFNLDENSRKIITDLVEYLRNLPTAYFEAKAQRAVDLGEFHTAIVPKDAPADVLQILQDSGVKIEKYDRKKEGARRAAIEKVGKKNELLFSRQERLARAGVDQAPEPTPAELAARPPAETRMQAFRRKAQDSMIRFKVVQAWLKDQGVDLTEAADVYVRQNLSKGVTANLMEDFRREVRDPLIQDIAASGWDIGDVATYLEALHIPEANERMRLIRKDPNATANGITDAQAAQVVADFQADPKFGSLPDLARRLREIGEESLNMRLNAGLITQEQYDAYKATYKNWVPLRGDMAKKGLGKGMSTSVKDKRRMGHKLRESEFVFENLMQDREAAIMQIEKNKVSMSVLDFVMQAANDAIGTVSKPVKRATMKDHSYAVALDGRLLASFETKGAADAAVTQILAGAGPRAVQGAGVVTPDRLSVTKTYDPHVVMMARPMLEANEIQAYVKGHAIRIQLTDENLARAATNGGIGEVGAIVDAARRFNGFLSRMYTQLSPDFILTNMARDFYSGVFVLTGKKGVVFTAKAAANYLPAFYELSKAALKGDPKASKWVRDYRAAGGNIGAAYMSDLERIGEDAVESLHEFAGARETYRMVRAQQLAAGASPAKARTMAALKAGVARTKTLPVVGKTFAFISAVNGVVENTLRLAAFKTAIESGDTAQEAALLSKDLLNFNRKGEMANQLGAAWIFYNAGAQGADITAEALFHSKHKGQVWALVGSAIALSFLLAEMGRGDDDDEESERAWKNIPDHLKHRNLIFNFGGSQFTVPVAYGWGFFHSMGNLLSDVLHGADIAKAAISLASSFLENFAVMGNPMKETDAGFELDLYQVAPTFIKTATGPSINEDSMGRQIMPTKFSDAVPDSQTMTRAVRGTLYQDIAEFLNESTGGSKYEPGALDVSPNTLKYWVTSLTGGAGRFVSDMVTGIEGAAQGVAPDPEAIPVARRFYRESGVTDSRSGFWKAKKEAADAAARFNKAVKDGDTDYIDKALDESGDIIALARYAEKSGKMASFYRDAVLEINADKTMPLSKRKAEIKKLEQEERQVYDDFLRLFDEASRKK